MRYIEYVIDCEGDPEAEDGCQAPIGHGRIALTVGPSDFENGQAMARASAAIKAKHWAKPPGMTDERCPVCLKLICDRIAAAPADG